MALYQRGSLGSEVARIQQRLKELRLYRGPVDGQFGGGTESAVIAFQRSRKLTADGKVGRLTWKELFGGRIPTPSIAAKPLDFRVFALTGSFETGAPVPECFSGLAGDFDGQGMSLGVLQWNFGQGTLQPLLSQMLAKHSTTMTRIFHAHLPVLRAVLNDSPTGQLQWVRSIQAPSRRLVEPWAGMFKSLGRTDQYQQIQLKAAGRLLGRARTLCASYGLGTERGVALMFDILAQNGSISATVEATIRQEFRGLGSLRGADREVGRMRVIAIRRAEAALPQWVADVRARKLTIAEGAGSVHGKRYELAGMYGIRLEPFQAGAR